MKVTIDLICRECEGREVLTIEWSKTLWDDRWECGDCGCLDGMQRIPSPMTTKRVSLPDGNNRLAAIKASAKLEREAMDLPRSERGEMLQAAHEIKKIKK